MPNIIKQIVKDGEYGSQTIRMIVKSNERGPQGEQGEPGVAATIAAGNAYSVPSTSNPQVMNTGTSSAAVFDFYIPKGEKGDKGDTGEPGEDGKDGAIQYTAGSGINISSSNVISTVQAAPVWGSIEGTLSNQTDLKNALDAKQGTLTAGSNITISGDTISSSYVDTTYSAGNAITIDSGNNNAINAAIHPADFFTATDTVPGSGKSITLNGTAELPLKEEQLNGDTTQSGTPTPTTPQTVNTVTGRQLVTISDGDSNTKSYEINLGKNLFNANAGTIIQSANIDSNNKITSLSGNSLAYVWVPKGTYTISFNGISSYTFVTAHTTSVPSMGATTSPRDVVSSANYATYTMPEDGYLITRINELQASASALQIEAGPTATTYAPYFTPIELCKIGTYQDYIYKSGVDWYLHKDLSKIVFDGSETTWEYESTSAQPFRYAISDAANLTTSQNIAPSVAVNYYTPVAWNITVNRPDYYVTSTVSKKVAFRNVDMASLSDWETWLSTHNTTVYYPLATPTDTKITNAALITQLNALASATSYDDQTVITVASPNIAGDISLVAYKKSISGIGASQVGIQSNVDTLASNAAIIGPTTSGVTQLVDNAQNNIYPLAGSVQDGTIATASIQDSAMTTAKIANTAVTAPKIDFTTFYDVIYDNPTGSNTTIALSSSVSNYQRIRIEYKTSDGNCYTQEMISPYGTTTLAGENPFAADDWYRQLQVVTVSGTAITFGQGQEVNINANNVASAYARSNIYITKVEGWKF